MKLRTLAASIVSAALVLAPSVAHACARDDVMHVEPGKTNPVIALQEAEHLLERGGEDDLADAIRLAAAARTSVVHDPSSASAVPRAVDGFSEERVTAAAERLAARATMLEQLGRSRSRTATPAERAFAADTIEKLRAANDGLVPDTTRAEVLSRVPERAEGAYWMLQELERKDLLGSAWEHAAIAELARAHGHDGRAGAAELRCRTLAVDASICTPDGASSGVAIAYGGSGAGLGLAAMASLLVKRRRARRSARLV